MWQVAWAHPSFGTILASASYDGKVFIWKQDSGQPNAYGTSGWVRIKEHALHTASGSFDDRRVALTRSECDLLGAA